MLSSKDDLKREIMLHVNEQLFEKGFISQEMFRGAKKKIVSSPSSL